MQQGSSTKILVVDDAVTTRQRLCRLLAELGNVEATACEASPAQVLPRLRELRPRCVVIDVPVHDAGGFALLEEVRRAAASSIVVVLTNHVSEQFRARGARAGVDHFLSKAKEFERVVDIVRELGQAS